MRANMREARDLEASAFNAGEKRFEALCQLARKQKLDDESMKWIKSLPRRKRRAFLAEMRRA